jgi:PAS domain S-box-containing protein
MLLWISHISICRGVIMEIHDKQILDVLPDSIRIINKEKKVVWANKLFKDLVGMEKEGIDNKRCHAYLCISRSLGEEHCYLDKIISEDAVSQKEIAIKDRKDKTITFLATYTPYRNEKEEVIGIVEYPRDITNLVNIRTALEERLMRSKAYWERPSMRL